MDNQSIKTSLRKRTYIFSLGIIKLIASFPNSKLYWVFTDQLLRVATSIGANIIEASAQSSKRDFINFYCIALKSANETIYWMSLLKESDLVESKDIDALLDEVNQLAKIIAASLLTMKGKR